MKKILLLPVLTIFFLTTKGQPCNPEGNQTSYGANNVWIGYVYDNKDLTNYKGYVNEGNAQSANFDENFGGSNTTYTTHGCNIQTETFSVRYKLAKDFVSGSYKFTIGGDDGYRLSLDGGNTWVINKWNDQSYAVSSYSVSLEGLHNLVLEYYENGGDNRISFTLAATGCGMENTTTYGAGNWNGYMYEGIDFNTYVGMITEGNTSDPSFSENFGGSNTQFGTSGCNIQTETFSARFRMSRTFANGNYTFIVGGDDGYRLSLDGGATWIINNWTDHSYMTTTVNVHLSGTYNMVLEYYERSGDNYLTFAYQTGTLPVKLISFDGKEQNGKTQLAWAISTDSDPDYFEVEKSTDGSNFNAIINIDGTKGVNNGNAITYTATDALMDSKTWYRLKMVDMSGAVTYSKTVMIAASNAVAREIRIFPSIITNNTFKIHTGETINNTTVTMTDLSGKMIFRNQYGRVNAGQTINIQLSGTQLPRGMYIVRIADDAQAISTQKIIIQ